ncbi:MAG TPA: hypothetical protein VNL14_07340 [Candidatus Acidoferrales bacterium]|nr:hypothetical protein [Candidatus Acidoferrales bacterium]
MGIFLVLVALGGASLAVMGGGARVPYPGRRWVAVTHGLGLLIALVSGFGLLARLGIDHGAAWPLWVWAKIGIWVVLGALPAVIARYRQQAALFWWLVPLLAGAAAYLAITKPL